MREHLVVVRCGRGSRHAEWAAGNAPRNFDLLLCPYQDGVPAGPDLPHVERTISGQKWSGLFAFLAKERVWERYAYVWLPDDDLETDAATISRFFDRCREHDASLAAPALAEGSQYSHLVTLRNRAFKARETTFVEVMAACFRRDVLAELLPTFSASATGFGWGLDDAWGRLLGYRGIFVMDETAVRHDRPIGTMRVPKDAEDAKDEMRRVRRRFGACSMRKTLGGVLVSGEAIDERSPRFLETYLGGYAWHLEKDPDARRRLRRDQAKDPAAWIAGTEGRTRGAKPVSSGPRHGGE